MYLQGMIHDTCMYVWMYECIIFPNSDFRPALTEHEWNWNQLLIHGLRSLLSVMVIDCCHGYVNAWMYGSYSTFSCSNLIQAKESEQFQYFAIKNNETRFYSQLIQFLQSAKENGGGLLCV